LSDEEFVRDFEGCRVANTDFRHADHIRLGWIFLQHQSIDAAIDRMVAAIRRFAVHNHGDTGMFHETITRVWMRLIFARMDAAQSSFAEFADVNLDLFDKKYMFEFYSEPLLMSDAARTNWVEPDLKPLP
jgi:hypothetical protein